MAYIYPEGQRILAFDNNGEVDRDNFPDDPYIFFEKTRQSFAHEPDNASFQTYNADFFIRFPLRSGHAVRIISGQVIGGTSIFIDYSYSKTPGYFGHVSDLTYNSKENTLSFKHKDRTYTLHPNGVLESQYIFVAPNQYKPPARGNTLNSVDGVRMHKGSYVNYWYLRRLGLTSDDQNRPHYRPPMVPQITRCPDGRVKRSLSHIILNPNCISPQ